MTDSLQCLNRFYSLLSRLEASAVQGRPLRSYTKPTIFPRRGVYFFREPGEYRSPACSDLRIVRVGTHAVSAGAKSTLWGRLRTHLGTRHGAGNHRSSIFRLHVGAALLAREGVSIPTWGIGSSMPAELRTDPHARAAEQEWECKVSKEIGSMSVLWVDVPDEPGPASMRARIERNAIALLSNAGSPIEAATSGWLGHISPRAEIRTSLLWNLNYVFEPCAVEFLNDFEIAVDRTLRNCT